MRITYRTLGMLIGCMDDNQLDSDVTVEIPTEGSAECYAAELRLAGENHDGGLDDGHPVLYAHVLSDAGDRQAYRNQLPIDIGFWTEEEAEQFQHITFDASTCVQQTIRPLKPGFDVAQLLQRGEAMTSINGNHVQIVDGDDVNVIGQVVEMNFGFSEFFDYQKDDEA